MSIRCTVESAFFIAWSCLEKSGELGAPDQSANVILDAIEAQLRTGERRQLMLANRAIDTYRAHAAKDNAAAEREARLG
ncbi:hypothetical protein JQ581_01455 [Bradyrhizobium liaoningense]|uniref:hypothetical protein n=1 Tax=Bradyrhizobium liaoningense TaxID=43992 RepID=UPI001BA9FC2B|nr:hypothetical protein [Bradyrhizobium liaoningense]MBR0735580.1 hypothetical protein [Bradyrhizobium liaoningense]MBR0901669.1 hypothetical protein [Bradyrhizobium liaoningense]